MRVSVIKGFFFYCCHDLLKPSLPRGTCLALCEIFSERRHDETRLVSTTATKAEMNF